MSYYCILQCDRLPVSNYKFSGGTTEEVIDFGPLMSDYVRVGVRFMHQTACYKNQPVVAEKLRNKTTSPALTLICALANDQSETDPLAIQIKVGKNVQRQFAKMTGVSQIDHVRAQVKTPTPTMRYSISSPYSPQRYNQMTIQEMAPEVFSRLQAHSPSDLIGGCVGGARSKRVSKKSLKVLENGDDDAKFLSAYSPEPTQQTFASNRKRRKLDESGDTLLQCAGGGGVFVTSDPVVLEVLKRVALGGGGTLLTSPLTVPQLRKKLEL